ncbi:recombinase family protein [Acutalibacter muris]|uniref:Recombinase family protein n=1 Tax=Acutalibacter muris TaxID=1796620 RepID=A0A1Z2XSF5_9FIRM|nr:recombinase family protein [Acutalibacter muris]ANU55388.1 hypothetical protein A4V00_15970 [Hungateiclostridiaceae bacterium KB18]ASB41377.1 hypothetical protein ADH66_12350 [Acutalibacter muris]QQR30639.1 recombinase family protein [Acutalibacter muris]
MARTKRKVNPLASGPDEQIVTQKVYKTGAYIRLSVEDSGKPGADTIEAQKELVLGYIDSQTDMQLCGLYCDNGRTGTNFQRPEFDLLMEDIRAGKIDCIVVKDLSRFGRNYKETGNYLERIFPYLDVRFVAVNDSFDTASKGQNEGYIVPLTNILNETYSRDISRKVSTAIKAMELQGHFHGPAAPYGYAKSPENHNKLVINPETAPIVQSIFKMRLEGMGYRRIACALNDNGVLSPGAYLYKMGFSQREIYRDTLWTTWNIKTLLNNEVYLGHLVQGKRTQASYKQARKDRYAPPEEWRVVRDTHEPLVSEEMFAEAQGMAEQSKADYQAMTGKGDELKTPNLFKKIIHCGDCGKAMCRRHVYNRTANGRVYYYSYKCTTHIKMPSACTPKNLKESALLEVVRVQIEQHLTAVARLEEMVLRECAAVSAKKHIDIDRRIQQAQQAQSRSKKLLEGLYQNLAEGVISREEYASMKAHYREQCAGFDRQMAELETERRSLERYGPQNPMFKVCRDYQGAELSEELIHALIAGIDVYDDSRLELKLVYQDEFAEVSRFWKGGGEQ